MTALILVVRFVRCLVAANFGGGGGGGNDVLVGDSFKSSCAVLDDMGGATAAAGGVAPGGVAPPLTSFYDAAVTSSSSQCDVTRSNGLTSSFGFTQEQVACVCEVRARVCGYTPQVSNENVDCWDFNRPFYHKFTVENLPVKKI